MAHTDEQQSEPAPKCPLRIDTLAIIGCGALGTAILLGLLSETSVPCEAAREHSHSSRPAIPTHFIACVRRDQSANAVRQVVDKAPKSASSNVDIKVLDNVNSASKADIVLLAVQPHMLSTLLQEPDMRQALNDKIIISVLAGVTVADIKSVLGSSLSGTQSRNIIRVMPNINCFAKASTTVIERGDFPQPVLDLVSQLFSCLGKVFYTEPDTMDACTALCGSTPAFFTVVLEGLIEGAIATGVKPADALEMAAHVMLGTATLVMQGRQPTAVRHEVMSPKGSTVQGVLELEEGRTRWTFARALQIAAGAAAKLGSK